jgi:hypothetical protein
MIQFIYDGSRLVGSSSTNECKIKTFYAFRALLNAKKKSEQYLTYDIQINAQAENERNHSYALS